MSKTVICLAASNGTKSALGEFRAAMAIGRSAPKLDVAERLSTHDIRVLVLERFAFNRFGIQRFPVSRNR